jgi:hypothetical protein
VFSVFKLIIIIMSGYTYLTQEGMDKLNAELDELKSTGRQEAAKGDR